MNIHLVQQNIYLLYPPCCTGAFTDLQMHALETKTHLPKHGVWSCST